MIRLGWDIDDVVLDTSTEIIKEVEKRANIEIDINKIIVHSIEKCYPVDKKLVEECVISVLERSYIPPVTMASEFINCLLDNCISFLTRRPANLFEITLDQLYNIGIRKDFDLYLVENNNNEIPAKAEVINNKDIKVFVEDRSDTILDILANTNCNIITMDKPWNRDIQSGDRVLRVKDWLELFPLVMKFILTGEFRK